MGGTVAYLVAEASDLVERLVIEDTPTPRAGSMPPMPDVPATPPFDVEFDWEVTRQLTPELRDPDPRWWDDLADIAAPTLLGGGGDESPIDQQRLADVADRIPAARFVSLGGGHYVHAAMPTEFLAVLRDFLSDAP
jgi:pimeloyl-ACP methyl ester carboxylesterase